MRQILSSITRPIVSNYLTTDSIDLKLMIKKRFGVDFHERYVGTLLKKLGFSHVSARPRHPGQDVEIIAAFKKTSPKR